MRFGLDNHSDSSSDDPDSPLPAQPSSRSARPTTTRTRSTHPASSPTAPREPFNPTPLRLVRPPSLKHPKHRPRSLAPPSPDSPTATNDLLTSSSDDDDDEGSSSADDHDSGSDLDSEEEAWPVGPVNSVGPAGWRRRGAPSSARKGKGRAADYPPPDPPRVFGAPDDLDVWDDKQRASSWALANRTFHLSLARSRHLSPALHPPTTSSSSTTRRSATTSSSSPPSTAAASTDLDSISSLLSQLALQHERDAAALVRGFEQRNQALWDSIEQSIRAAELEEGERQRALVEAREREEEAQRRAKEMREAEERRVEEEKRRKEAEDRAEEEERVKREKEDEEDRARRAEEERRAAAKASALGLAPGDAEGSPEHEFKRWTAKMQHIKQAVLPVVSQNPAWRKACFQAKRAITPKIGQLTSSATAIARITAQLDDVLSSMRAPPPAGPGAPEPYTWTLNHLAKALVKQAETEVTAKLGTAYPLARVVVGLLLRGHDELGDVLMARLVKKCFWVTGHFPRRAPGDTDEAHQKTLGHAPPTSSETLVQYAERMSGLVALYAAILQTSPLTPPQGPPPSSPDALRNVPPHFRPAAGWRWLALVLRAPLVALEPTPLLVVTFLEVAGAALVDVYGAQMRKLLECLLREGVREAKAGFSDKARGSQVRLLLWLEEWEKTGTAECAKGREVDP
ncbi:hypothetical protein JCM8208_004314 [Rhodotorula glutinis]